MDQGDLEHPREEHLEELLNMDDQQEWFTLISRRLQNRSFQGKEWNDIVEVAADPNSDPVDRHAAFVYLVTHRPHLGDDAVDCKPMPAMTDISAKHRRWIKEITGQFQA